MPPALSRLCDVHTAIDSPGVTAPADLSPAALAPIAATLRRRLEELDYTPAGLHRTLGPAHSCLERGEPAPLLALAADSGPSGTLIAFFLLGVELPRSAAEDLLGADCIAGLAAAGLLTTAAGHVAMAVDIRPMHLPQVEADIYVVSDYDGRLHPRPIHADHVLGPGHASLTLLRAQSHRRGGRVLDLGCGCGIQSLAAAHRSAEVIATDISQRCCDMTACSAMLSGITTITTRHGSWFEPVAGEFFDEIISNPPFVISDGVVTHSYRDSGLALDGATRLVVEQLPAHLAEGGQASLLGAWVATADTPGADRVAEWIATASAELPTAAWLTVRDQVDPFTYVGTWLRDGGQEPTSEIGQDRHLAWLEYLADAGVTQIELGVLYLRRTAEQLPLRVTDTSSFTTLNLGVLADAMLTRLEQLGAGVLSGTDYSSLIQRHCAAHPGAAIYAQHQEPLLREFGEDPALHLHTPEAVQILSPLSRDFQVDVPTQLLPLIRGLHPEGLPIGDVVDFFATLHDLDEAAARAAILPLIVELLLQGSLVLSEEDPS